MNLDLTFRISVHCIHASHKGGYKWIYPNKINEENVMFIKNQLVYSFYRIDWTYFSEHHGKQVENMLLRTLKTLSRYADNFSPNWCNKDYDIGL